MEFDYFESGTNGTGPALLFLPGSYSSHSAWRGVQSALNGSYRMITTSLPGYGATPEIRDESVRDLDQMSEFVARIVDRIGEPVHLVGHSYGGLCAYAAALSGRITPRSIITFEANPVFCQAPAGPFDWLEDLRDMQMRFSAALSAGDPEAAGIIIDFWSHPGNFNSMPEAFRSFCQSKAATNLLDWHCAMGFTAEFSAFARLAMPCTVARGEHANPAITDVSDQIVAHAPDAVLHVEPGAGHFLITTHPQACAAVIDAHMARVMQ